MTEFLTSNWLPNILGLIGGILGIWSFVDNYIIRFKPKIYIATKVIFDTEELHNFTRLKSIIFSSELCNHRKKYGVVYDFAVRIYKSDEINSDSAIYYASEIIDKIPLNTEEIENQELQSYNPITILPNSNKSVNICFSEVPHRSTLIVNKSANYYLEAYYQKEPKGKWNYIDKLYLYNKTELGKVPGKFISFTVLNKDITKEKLKENIKIQKTNMYEGASKKTLHLFFSRLKYRLFFKPIKYIVDTFKAVPFYLNILRLWFLDKYIKIPIIQKYGKKIERVSVTFGDKENRKITEKIFKDIYDNFKSISDKMNLNATENAMTAVTLDKGQIIISRYKLSVKIYIAGDSSIYVQELNSINGSRLTYSLDLKRGLWNKNFWYLKNYGFIKPKSFVVKVLDAFIIHSSY